MEDFFYYFDTDSITPVPSGVAKHYALGSKVIVAGSQNKGSIVFQPHDLVIIGVDENRNSSSPSSSGAPTLIRRRLYALAGIELPGRIVDLGNIKPTANPRQTYAALQSVVAHLASKGVTFIIIGGSQDITIPIIKGLGEVRETLNLCVVDSMCDMGGDDDMCLSQSYLGEILHGTDTSPIFDFSLVAYQKYLVSPPQINLLRKRHHEVIRLGLVQSNIRETEPVFRNSDMVSIDLCAVRSSDACGSGYPTPNGLYAEEMCQLARYAGFSDRATCMGLFGLVPENDNREQSAILSAQILWHFIEGFSQRKHEMPVADNSSFQKFIVNTGTPNADIIFYRSDISDSWWMEVSGNNQSEVLIVPCSQNDYIQATKQEVPERWLRYIYKLSDE